MRQYELVIIIDPTIDERKIESMVQGLLEVVPKNKGKIDKVDIWGKRRFAYEIQKHEEGIYVIVDLTADPDTVKELDRQLSLNESILRVKVMRNEATTKKAAAKPKEKVTAKEK